MGLPNKLFLGLPVWQGDDETTLNLQINALQAECEELEMALANLGTQRAGPPGTEYTQVTRVFLTR